MRISIVMEALTGSFETDINRASRRADRQMRQMRRSAEQFARRAAVAFAAVGTAVAAMVRQQVNLADEMSKTAQRIGVSTEALSQLEHVAKLSGTSMEGLQTSLVRLARVSSDAQNGLATATRAFEAIGVSAENADGSLREMDDLLLDIADRFAGMDDATRKAALAQELFGRSGAQLIPMLNQGRDGIEALMLEADRLGLTLGTNTARAAEAFNDNLTRLRGQLTGFQRQVTAQMLPALNGLTTRLADAAIETGGFASQAERSAEVIVGSMAFVMDAVEGVRRVFQVVGRSIAVQFAAWELGAWTFYDAIVNGPIAGMNALIRLSNRLPGIELPEAALLPGIGPHIREQMERAAAIVREGAGDMQDVLMRPMPGRTLMEDFRDRTNAVVSEAVSGASTIGGATEEAVSRVGDMIAALERQSATLGMTANEVRLYEMEMEGASQSQLNYSAALLKSVESQQAMDQAQQDAGRVFESTRTSLERFNAEIQRLNELRDTHVDGAPLIDQETYARAVEAAQDAFEQMESRGDMWGAHTDELTRSAARNIQSAFADFLFDPFENGLRGMVKSFADALRRMAAQAAASGILRAVAGSFGGPIGAAASAIFGGGRAAGGPVNAGTTYMVGERGPELFRPDVSGSIIPNHDLGPSLSLTINAEDPGAEGRIRTMIEREMVPQILNAATNNTINALSHPGFT